MARADLEELRHSVHDTTRDDSHDLTQPAMTYQRYSS
jgi:hypothetical protein